jgi:hypothetical protein
MHDSPSCKIFFPVTIRQAQPRPNLPFQTSRSLLDKATPCGSTFCSPQLIRLSGFQQTGRCRKPPRLLLSLNNKEVIYRKIPCTVTESRGLRYVDTCMVIRHLPYTYATGSCIARLWAHLRLSWRSFTYYEALYTLDNRSVLINRNTVFVLASSCLCGKTGLDCDDDTFLGVQAIEREQKSTHPETAQASARTEESGRTIGGKGSEGQRERATEREEKETREERGSEWVCVRLALTSPLNSRSIETRTEWFDLHVLAIWANNGLLEHRLQVRLHMYLFYVQY